MFNKVERKKKTDVAGSVKNRVDEFEEKKKNAGGHVLGKRRRGKRWTTYAS